MMKVDELLKLSKDELKGKVICFPTDTVYGIGVLFNDLEGSQKIYDIKQRDLSKPLANLASSVEEILPYIKNYSDEALNLGKKYWPGALTIIFEKNEESPILINQETSTIGFRIPNSQVALKILKKFGIMATTSINLSGEPPLNDYETIVKLFGNQIDYIIEEENENKSNISSTVVDATSKYLKVLRLGDIRII